MSPTGSILADCIRQWRLAHWSVSRSATAGFCGPASSHCCSSHFAHSSSRWLLASLNWTTTKVRRHTGNPKAMGESYSCWNWQGVGQSLSSLVGRDVQRSYQRSEGPATGQYCWIGKRSFRRCCERRCRLTLAVVLPFKHRSKIRMWHFWAKRRSYERSRNPLCKLKQSSLRVAPY